MDVADKDRLLELYRILVFGNDKKVGMFERLDKYDAEGFYPDVNEITHIESILRWKEKNT